MAFDQLMQNGGVAIYQGLHDNIAGLEYMVVDQKLVNYILNYIKK